MINNEKKYEFIDYELIDSLMDNMTEHQKSTIKHRVNKTIENIIQEEEMQQFEFSDKIKSLLGSVAINECYFTYNLLYATKGEYGADTWDRNKRDRLIKELKLELREYRNKEFTKAMKELRKAFGELKKLRGGAFMPDDVIVNKAKPQRKIRVFEAEFANEIDEELEEWQRNNEISVIEYKHDKHEFGVITTIIYEDYKTGESAR